MATHTQSSSLKTTWEIDTSNDVWKFLAGLTIRSDKAQAVHQSNQVSGDTVIINGDVKSHTIQVVELDGDDTTLTVGADAKISGGNVGTDSGGHGFEMTNKGHILGGVTGAFFSFGGTLDNQGVIKGDEYGMYCDNEAAHLTNGGKIGGALDGVFGTTVDGSDFVNLAGGEISGGTAIDIEDSDGVTITNAGLVSGATAISGLKNSTLAIVNHGTIEGDVMLGDGDDVFDTRGGIFEGTVSGGGGSDTYLVDRTDIAISEAADGGQDTVKSAASFTLGDNIEILQLLGHKAISGTGNAGADTLYGNSGANRLRGLAGQDVLFGGKGDDTMTGGKDTDFFGFNDKTGHDTVTDFKNGVDAISSSFVNSDADAADLLAHHAEQQDKGVLITYGSDSLLIRHMQLADLNSGDFFYF